MQMLKKLQKKVDLKLKAHDYLTAKGSDSYPDLDKKMKVSEILSTYLVL